MYRRFGVCAQWVVLFLVITAVAEASGLSSKPLMFFSNSTRRDANSVEAAQVARTNGCAAFFLENTVGKIFMGSARHCYSRAVTNWCATNGKVTKNNGEVGKCTRIIAADVNHDIFIFEASFPTPPDAVLKIAAYQAAVKTPLQMVGYPGDKYRSGKLTTTEDCWILDDNVPSPHPSHSGDISALHNCTTYGGNSGGPMIAEGTDVVVGLPFTYMPGDYHLRDPNDLSTASTMAQMWDLVSKYRSTLEAEGIVIVD